MPICGAGAPIGWPAAGRNRRAARSLLDRLAILAHHEPDDRRRYDHGGLGSQPACSSVSNRSAHRRGVPRPCRDGLAVTKASVPAPTHDLEASRGVRAAPGGAGSPVVPAWRGRTPATGACRRFHDAARQPTGCAAGGAGRPARAASRLSERQARLLGAGSRPPRECDRLASGSATRSAPCASSRRGGRRAPTPSRPARDATAPDAGCAARARLDDERRRPVRHSRSAPRRRGVEERGTLGSLP
jgi:hypothetical protein